MLALLLAAPASAASFWPVTPQTPQARSITFLFWIVIAVSGVILFGVLGALVLFIIRYRARPGAAEPRPIYGNMRLELWWTAIPFVLLVGVYAFMVGEVRSETTIASNALDITVIGHQWWWEYRYPDNVVAANELHVPVGRQVRLTLQSADVVHTFWVPDLAGKEQTIPGQNNIWTFTAEKAGDYDGACSEYCGTQHGWMRLKVIADQPADFDRWLAAQRQPLASLPSSDSDAVKLFNDNACGGCHTVNGMSNGRVAPDLTHIGSRTTIGAGVLANTPENMTRWMANPQEFKPGSLMPNFHFTQEQARQMAALLEDLK
ncbi:MAG TPA: cytochrome c oxidase subunit II [Chloroflexota bacterium]|nr:cytochrome c oxidase subunit II [Chloroflexota bacterium]